MTRRAKREFLTMLSGACALAKENASCDKCDSNTFERCDCVGHRVTLTCVCGHVQADKSVHAIGRRVNTKTATVKRGPQNIVICDLEQVKRMNYT